MPLLWLYPVVISVSITVPGVSRLYYFSFDISLGLLVGERIKGGYWPVL